MPPTILRETPDTLLVLAQIENKRRVIEAELRQLEYDTGMTASQTGEYWLARTAGLERLLAVVVEYLKGAATKDDLRAALHYADAPRAPACRPGDHQESAA